MCNFFSCISDGNGNVSHFTLHDVVSIMATGNPEDYNFNSHTSYMAFAGIKGRKEDEVNKWEYNPDTKALTADALYAECDDRVLIQAYLDKYFAGKNVGYLRNLYGRNAGSDNAGSDNSGDNCCGAFNTKPSRTMFNAACTDQEYAMVKDLDMSWFAVLQWVPSDNMTDAEKVANQDHATTGGFLRPRPYKEAWSYCPAAVRKQIKALPRFDAAVFEEITGLKFNPSGRRKER